jgi:hypothetical protein
MNDWRLQGQEKYLTGVTLVLKQYQPYREGWDHDHCAFCWQKFSLNAKDLHEGYATEDNYHWICVPCFNEFKSLFGWQLSSTR